MIFTGFKRKSNQIFLNKRMPDLLEKLPQNSSTKIKNALIFLDDNSDKLTIKKELISIFNISEDDITFVVFQQKVRKEEISEDIITPKDFGWNGKINSDKLKIILTKKYDLLINYSKVENSYINLLILQCNVGFRVGFGHLDKRFYDLRINCDESDILTFNNELKKYLTILNKIV